MSHTGGGRRLKRTGSRPRTKKSTVQPQQTIADEVVSQVIKLEQLRLKSDEAAQACYTTMIEELVKVALLRGKITEDEAGLCCVTEPGTSVDNCIAAFFAAVRETSFCVDEPIALFARLALDGLEKTWVDGTVIEFSIVNAPAPTTAAELRALIERTTTNFATSPMRTTENRIKMLERDMLDGNDILSLPINEIVMLATDMGRRALAAKLWPEKDYPPGMDRDSPLNFRGKFFRETRQFMMKNCV